MTQLTLDEADLRTLRRWAEALTTGPAHAFDATDYTVAAKIYTALGGHARPTPPPVAAATPYTLKFVGEPAGKKD